MASYYEAYQNWQCPTCEQNILLDQGDIYELNQPFQLTGADNGASGQFVFRLQLIACRLCHIFTATASFYRPQLNPQGSPQAFTGSPRGRYIPNLIYREVQLYPLSTGRQFDPKIVPPSIVRDYNEASSIVDLSARSAAVLARRCLEMIVTDYYKSTAGKTLHKRIEAVRGRLDSDVYDAIMALKGLGNIGAHADDDLTNETDLSASDAQEALNMVALLLDDTYIADHRKKQQLNQIIATHGAKKK